MPLPASFAQTTFDVYRAFGGAQFSTGNFCKLVEQMDIGRRPESAGLNWSHYIDFNMPVDVRDGVTRVAGSNTFTYADGDEIRIPDSNGTTYVTVFVLVMNFGTPNSYKRALLLRDAPVFTGTGWT